MKMKAFIVFLLLAVGLGFVIWDQVREPSNIIASPKEKSTEKAYKVPDFSFQVIAQSTNKNTGKDTGGNKTHRLHDFKGKVIVLNLWATWCAPCVVEFPQLLKLAELKKDKMVLIALSVDEAPKNIQKFLKKLNPPDQSKARIKSVIIGHDPGKSISQDLFQTVSYPETFIISPNLTIEKKVTGITDWTSEYFLSFIDTLAATHPSQ